jgi:hypothetical protein
MTQKSVGVQGQSKAPRANIFDHAQPTFVAKGAVVVDKVQRFGWETIDEPGELHWLDKDTLSVDHEIYQRQIDNPAKVNKIAGQWSWMACGALTVAIRQSGTYWVIDGQNRLAAARKRSDIKTLPCLVFLVDSPEAEAAAFVRINKNRRSLSRVEMFKAEVAMKDEYALRLVAVLERYGYRVAVGGNRRALQCVDCLLRLLRESPNSLEVVLDVHNVVLDSGKVLTEMVNGMAFLIAQGVDFSKPALRRRIAQVGHDAILKSIRDTMHFRGASTQSIYAEGIARAVNKGLRNDLIVLDAG